MVEKKRHEFRDPIHNFIHVDSDERKVIDSRPFQRLRHIHQLALTYLVYPGATHRRFEHSLGVMDLAGRVFDVITEQRNIHHNSVREIVPSEKLELSYWRRVVRIAALCHDIGHLPFSHAAEHELLPSGWDHERLTVELLRSDEMRQVFEAMTPTLKTDDVLRLAVGPKKLKNLPFSLWQAILAEVIVGDAFGVDRMDYLLRDAYHSGVAYGVFDHHRVIDTLRILPKTYEQSEEPALGLEVGGLHAAEALAMARYYMYSQVYFHPVRRIYDIHLQDFLKAWLPGGLFPTSIDGHLNVTDAEVTAGLLKAARNPNGAGHDAAAAIASHRHFKLVYSADPDDFGAGIYTDAWTPAHVIRDAVAAKFGRDHFRVDHYVGKAGSVEFPVQMRDGSIRTSSQSSQVFGAIPSVRVSYLFADRSKAVEAERWISANRARLFIAVREMLS